MYVNRMSVMGEDWKKGLTVEQLQKFAKLEDLAKAYLQHQELPDESTNKSESRTSKKNVVLVIQEASATSAEPGMSPSPHPSAISHSSPISPFSIPNSHLSHSETSLYADSLAKFLAENENKDITGDITEPVLWPILQSGMRRISCYSSSMSI